MLTFKATSTHHNQQTSTHQDLGVQSQIQTPPLRAINDRCKLSEWGLPPLIVSWFRNKGITTLFEWQVECLCKNGVLHGRNLVYSAPTSAGKTLVADFLLLKQIFENRKKALFIEPFIALAREKATSLKSMLWTTKARVGAFCGSYYTPGGLTAVSVAVCTIEKANNIINKLIGEGKLSDLGIIIVDEIHYLGDPSRGHLLELLLTKVKFYNQLKDSNCRIQIVGLSATIPNLSCLANWLDAELYITEYRPVPLKEKIKIGNNIYEVKEYLEDKNAIPIEVIDRGMIPVQRDIEDICYICIDSIIKGHSTLVFCESRRECEVVANTLADQIKKLGQKINSDNEREREVSQALRKNLSSKKILDRIAKLKSSPAGADEELTRPLKFGAAFHHAGLTSEEREIIEDGFKEGCIKALMATSTLSSGVNLPARRVIIKSPLCYSNRSKEILDPMVYKQMVGRAGRKNIDTHGESILLCNEETQSAAIKLISTSLNNISSSLGYRMISIGEKGEYNYDNPSSGLKKALLEVIANNTAKTRLDIDNYLKSSFWLSSSTLEDQKSFLKLVDRTLIFLANKKFIEEINSGVYRATRLGNAVLASGLAPDESLDLLNDLIKAREGFCLSNDLHILYQITPNDIAKSIDIKDWINFSDIWSSLDDICQYVGFRVGIDETIIARKVKGYMNALTTTEERIYKKFLVALAINDLVNEMPLTRICSRYRLSRAIVQQAQRATAQFAGVLTIFCEQLGYDNIAALVKPLESRINFSCQRDLLELIRLNISRPVARSLYNAGYKSIISIARGEVQDLEFAIRQATPFKKDGSSQEETKKIFAHSPSMWIPELAKSMLIIDYAQHLVETARVYIEIEYDLEFSQAPEIRRGENAILTRNEANNRHQTSAHVENQRLPQNAGILTKSTNLERNEDENHDIQEQAVLQSEDSNASLSNSEDMPPVKDIPNFEVKYILKNCELDEFMSKWTSHSRVSLNFKVVTEKINDSIGVKILKDEKRLNSRISPLKNSPSRKRRVREGKSDLDSDSDDDSMNDPNKGITLQLDIDNQKHCVTRMYACFDDEFIVFVIKTPRALTYIQKNLRNYLANDELNQIKLYTQDIISTYKILLTGFRLSDIILNKSFEWQSFEVAWWMINNCPLRGRNNCNSSLSLLTKTKWIPLYHHFLYPSSKMSNISTTSRSEFMRIKDIVKSGKTAILQPLIDELLIELDKRNQLNSYYCAEIPSRLILADMMIHGIGISPKILNRELRLYEDLLQQLTDISRELYSKSNRSLVLTNIRQVARVLYEDLDLKKHLHNYITNSDISKDPTNAEVLNILMKFHPFPRVVQDFRKIGKALEALQSVSTHARFDNQLNMMRVSGKMDFWQATGRVAMWDPDLFLINRNFSIIIPAHQHRLEETIECLPRSCFVPYKNWELLTMDYSQLELRLLAHFSADKNLLSILNQKRQDESTYDVFKMVASRVYRTPIDDVTSDKRQHAKQICYGLIYGMGNKSLSVQLGVDVEAAREFRENFLAAFPRIDTYTQELLNECEKLGYVESILGRRRTIEYINSDRPQLRARAERVAINTKIQSSASDILKLSMDSVNKLILESYHNKARLVLEMHDELLFEVDPTVIEDFSQQTKTRMENLNILDESLKVKLLVNMKKGPDWSNLIDL